MTTRTERVTPKRREDVPELEPIFHRFEENTGTMPNNLLVMARRPALLRARAAMMDALKETTLDRGIRDLVFLMASLTVGCRYCRAHRTNAMLRRGSHEEKVRAVWEFETSPLFTDAERAALRLARDSALVPNAVTDEHFVELGVCHRLENKEHAAPLPLGWQLSKGVRAELDRQVQDPVCGAAITLD